MKIPSYDLKIDTCLKVDEYRILEMWFARKFTSILYWVFSLEKSSCEINRNKS